MVKTIVLLTLLFDGTLVEKKIAFNGTLKECTEYGEKTIKKLATHSWSDPRGQAWYLNDGTGTFQGFICL